MATWSVAPSWPTTLKCNGEPVATFGDERMAHHVMALLEAHEAGESVVLVSVFEDGKGAVSNTVKVNDGYRHTVGRFAVRVDTA